MKKPDHLQKEASLPKRTLVSSMKTKTNIPITFSNFNKCQTYEDSYSQVQPSTIFDKHNPRDDPTWIRGLIVSSFAPKSRSNNL